MTGLAASSASLSAFPPVGTTNQTAEPPFFSLITLSATSPSVTTSPYVVSPASVVQKSPDAVLGSGAVISVAFSAVKRT